MLTENVFSVKRAAGYDLWTLLVVLMVQQIVIVEVPHPTVVPPCEWLFRIFSRVRDVRWIHRLTID
jgi:hypothetical protein